MKYINISNEKDGQGILIILPIFNKGKGKNKAIVQEDNCWWAKL